MRTPFLQLCGPEAIDAVPALPAGQTWVCHPFGRRRAPRWRHL